MLLSEAPRSIIEQQPIQRFISQFLGKTDAMQTAAKHAWKSNAVHRKNYGEYSTRLMLLDMAIEQQLHGKITLDDLNATIGIISKTNGTESFIVEAILQSLRSDPLYHFAPHQALPHANISKSIFDNVYILEDRVRVTDSSITGASTKGIFRIVGKNHLPQQAMMAILK